MSERLTESLKHHTLHPTRGTTEKGLFRYHDGIVDIHWPHGLMSEFYNKYFLLLVGSPNAKKLVTTYQDQAAQFLIQQFPEFKLFMEEAHIGITECAELIKNTPTFRNKTSKLQALSEKSTTQVYQSVCERYFHNITKAAYEENETDLESVLEYALVLKNGQGTAKRPKEAQAVLNKYVETQYGAPFSSYKANIMEDKSYFSFPISNPRFYEVLGEVSLANDLFFDSLLAAIAMVRFDCSDPTLKAQKVYKLAHNIKRNLLDRPMVALDRGIPEIQQTTFFLLIDLAYNLNPVHPNYVALHDYALRQSFDETAKDTLCEHYRDYTGNGLQRYIHAQERSIRPRGTVCAS